MGGEVDVRLASLRRRVGIACLASLLLLLAVFDAPELTSLRWGVGLVSAAAVAGLLASTSRERSGDGTSPSAVWLSSILVGVGGLLVAFGALLVVDWYPTPGLSVASGVATFVVAATAAGAATVKRPQDRVLSPLRFMDFGVHLR